MNKVVSGCIGVFLIILIGTLNADVIGPDRYGYIAVDNIGGEPSPDFNWIDATGGTCSTIEDDSYVNDSLPFTFSFYGYSFTAVYIYDNGYITCGGIAPSIPSNSNFEEGKIALRRVIAPFWDDLIPKETSRICWIDIDVNGDGFSDRVYEWYDFAHQGDPSASLTFEVIFFQNTTQIKFQYLSMKNQSGAFADGSSATVGIRDRNNNYRYLLYSYNQGAITDGLAIVFDLDDDNDYLSNILESKYGTNPVIADTDGGGIMDGGEVAGGTDPTDGTDDDTTDSDGDTLPDDEETVMNLSPSSKDTDSDGVDDNNEISAGWNPLDPDTDDDGLMDGQEDVNNNGIVDGTETDPANPDTDGDYISDGVEAYAGTDPLDANSSIMSPELVNVNPTYNGCELAQVGVDSNGNANVVCDGSNGVLPEVYGLTYLFFDKDGNVLIDETLIPLPGAPAYESHRPRIAVLSDNTAVVVVYRKRAPMVPYFVRVNPYLDDLDGSSADPTEIVVVNKIIPVPSLRHMDISVDSQDNLHIVGEFHTEGHHAPPHKIQYLKMDKDGNVLVGPVTIITYGYRHHKKFHPKIAVDSEDNVHIIWRDTDGWGTWGTYWGGRPDISYVKLDNNGNILISPTTLGFPNRLGQADISAFRTRIYVVFGGHSVYIRGDEKEGRGRGLSLYLGIFDTAHDTLTVVQDFTPIIPGKGFIVWQHPTLNFDSGGNLHVIFSGIDTGAGLISNGYYYASVDYDGNLNLGPVLVSTANEWEQPGQDVYSSGNETVVHMAYQGAFGDINYRRIEVSSFMKTAPAPSTTPVPSSHSIPVISSVSPKVAEAETLTEFRITGSGFLDGASVSFIPSGATSGESATNVVVVNSYLILASITLSQVGFYDVQIQNPDGVTAITRDMVEVIDTVVPGPRGEKGCACLSTGDSAFKYTIGGFIPLFIAFIALYALKRRSVMRFILGTGVIIGMVLFTGIAFASVSGPDSYGYIATDTNEPLPSLNFNWIDATSGTAYTVFDDSYVQVNMPFNFWLYSDNSNTLYIYDNGFIAFSANVNNPSPTNGDFEHGRIPDEPVIAPFWDDLLPKSTSRIYTLSTSVDTPNCGSVNVYVVEWYDFAHQGDPSASFTFEVVFYDGWRRIDFNYLSMKDEEGAFGNGGSATVGIRDDYDHSFSYLLYSFNQSSIFSGLSVSFDLDTDRDRLPNMQENCVYGTDLNKYDTDMGGISDGGEVVAGTDPLNSDPLHDPEEEDALLVDSDEDGLYDSDESALGTDPNNPDTDGDGVMDGKEFSFEGASLGTNPLIPDTDSDGLLDGQEDEDQNGIIGYPAELNPLEPDSDGDGVFDSDEISTGTDPLEPDDSVLGLEKKVVNPSTNGCILPRVSVDNDGNAHVVCDNQSAVDPVDNGITYLMFDKAGNILIDETWIPLKTSSSQVEAKRPRIAFCGGRVYIVVYSWDGGNEFESPFLIILETSRDNQNGDPADPADIVLFNQQILDVSLRHLDVDVDSSCNVHIVGEYNSKGQRGEQHKIIYMKFDAYGELLIGPLTIVNYGMLHHKKFHPKISVDGSDNLHIIWRDTDGWGDKRARRFAIYYTKLDSDGNILIPSTPLTFPNRFCQPDIDTFRERVYILIPGHDFYESDDDRGLDTGLSLYLGIFDTSLNTLQTIRPFEPIFEGRGHLVNQRVTLDVDANGNTHILFPLEDLSDVFPDGYYYFSTDYNGNPNLHFPILVSTDGSRYQGGIAVWTGSAVVHMAYSSGGGDLNYRQISATSFVKTAPDYLGGINPVVEFVSPSMLDKDLSTVLTIKGSNFLEGATVSVFNREITATTPITDVVFVDHNTLYVNIEGGTLSIGTYDITVFNPEGYAGTLESAFTVIDTQAGGPGPQGPEGEACGCTSLREGAGGLSLLILGTIGMLFIKRRFSMVKKLGLTLIIAILPFTSFSAVVGYDNFGYVAVDSAVPAPSATYNWIDATSGTCSSIADDTYIYWNLPWSFTFYTRPACDIYMSDNGFLTFGTWWGASSPTNGNFQDGRLSSDLVHLIAPFWDDLLPKSTSQVCRLDVDVNGDGFSDRVYEWVDFAHQGDPSASFTFEVIFFQNTKQIKFQYQTMTNGTGAFGDGSSATIGIRRDFGSGVDYILYSYNQQGAITDGYALIFDFDSDGDRLPDQMEDVNNNAIVDPGETDPNSFDTDGGGVSDGAEILAGTDPTNPADDDTTDSDGDGFYDDDEEFFGLNPNSIDSDSDGVDDYIEVMVAETDPLNPDTDDDGLQDGIEDENGDGYVAPTETDPSNPDTDGDHIEDGLEDLLSTDPLDPESHIMSYEKTLNPVTGGCHIPSVVADLNGNVHVVCDNKQTGGPEITYLMLDKDGNILIDETWIVPKATFSTGSFVVRRPRIAVDSQNRVHIVFFAWDSSVDLERGFYILLAPYLDNRNGSSANPEDITLVNVELPVETLRHLDIALDSEDNAHIVGELHIPYGRRGTHHEIVYLKVGDSGEVLAGPLSIVTYGPVHHKKNHPRIAVDSQDNVNIIWRDTDGWGAVRAARFSLYYTKLDKYGNTLIPPTPLDFPNRFGQIDIASIGTRLYVVFGGHNFYERMDDGYGIYTGLPLYLGIFDVSGDTLTTVLPFTPIVPSYGYIVNCRPALDIDANGNIHILFAGYRRYDTSSRGYYYFSTDYNGNPNLSKPIFLSKNIDIPLRLYHSALTVEEGSTRIHAAYNDNLGNLYYRWMDVSSFVTPATPTIPPPVTSTLPAPVITAVSPPIVDTTVETTIHIFGGNFHDGLSVSLGSISLEHIYVDSSEEIIATFPAGVPEGVYNITVTNPDGQSTTLSNAITVSNLYVGEVGPKGKGGCACSSSNYSGFGGIFLFVFLFAGIRFQYWVFRRRK